MTELFAAVLVLASCAAAQPAPEASETQAHRSIIINPRLMQLPTARDMAAIYPKAAYRARVGAKVRLRCDVQVDGGLAPCTTVSAEPAGQGFEEATLALATKFKAQPKLVDGRPTPGGVVVIPIVFTPVR